MIIKAHHMWTTNIEQAKAIQEQLRNKIIKKDDFNPIKLIGGIDVGFEENGHITRAAIAILTWPNLDVIEKIVSRGPTIFPYVPGFLSFREIPEILKALERLKNTPDLIMCDGQGIAHPRQMGIASHLGLITDIPSIGAAKSILVGKHEEVGQKKGDWRPLIYKNEIIGAALRTREKVKLMYVSLGHRISLETSIEVVMKCLSKYRLPEPTRWAHKLASQLKQDKSL